MYALLAITVAERAAGPVDSPPAAPPPTIRNLAVPSASVTTETRRRVQSTVIPGTVWDAAPLASARSASAGTSAPPKRGNMNPPPGSPPEEGRASPWELPRGVGGCSRKGAQRRPVPGRRGGQPRGAGRPCPQRAAAVEQ